MRKLFIRMVFVLCLLTDANGVPAGRFSGEVHRDLNKRMLERVLTELDVAPDPKKFKTCTARFKKAHKIQDYLLVFCAKAHFDNCAFQKSIDYINRIQARNDKLFADYSKKGENRKNPGLDERRILLNTGKILHALQDFYSHTNYIELMQTRHENFSDVPALSVWTEDGQRKILALGRDEGLISDHTWWVFPKQCPDNTPSHKKLAKDTAEYISGKKPTIWKKNGNDEYLNGFEASFRLAEESTYGFLLYTFRKYPMLQEFCGTPEEK